MRSAETLIQALNFDLFLGYCHAADTGQWQQAAAPVNHRIMKVNILYTLLATIFTHTVILFLTFSTVFNKLYKIFNTLLENRVCIR